MKEELEKLHHKALDDIAAAETLDALFALKSRLLGKKGKLTAYFTRLRELPDDQRPEFGKEVNRVKQELESEIEARRKRIAEKTVEKKLGEARLDITLPGLRPRTGHLHPLTRITDEIIDIFMGLGFDVVEGPEVETDYFNFEALNLHKDHPARDEQDSFYITPQLLMRTQTSPVQIRTMLDRGEPPVQVIAPGRTFRRDAVDASHSPVFHQVEGLLVDRHITLSHLKAVLFHFAREMFGPKTEARFRPDFFPFTEPSVEMAISCTVCGGEGCSVCSRTGWLEILGSGVVHPQVIRNGGLDPDECTGFAFGMGVERIAMLKHGIDDIRLFYENDVRFLKQF